MRDTVLKNFVERATRNGISVVYPPNLDNDFPQLRPVKDSFSPPMEITKNWREHIKTNHIKINAERKQAYGEDDFYKNGESYNLMFAIADDNCVIIEYGGAIYTDKDTFWRYTSLAQFLEYWIVNPAT